MKWNYIITRDLPGECDISSDIFSLLDFLSRGHTYCFFLLQWSEQPIPLCQPVSNVPNERLAYKLVAGKICVALQGTKYINALLLYMRKEKEKVTSNSWPASTLPPHPVIMIMLSNLNNAESNCKSTETQEDDCFKGMLQYIQSVVTLKVNGRFIAPQFCEPTQPLLESKDPHLICLLLCASKPPQNKVFFLLSRSKVYGNYH